MNENKFILDNFFNNNEKILALNLEPLEPQEIIFLATDWISEFCDIKIISIFKIVNPSSGNYQYFTLDSDFDIMEYIPEHHTFTSGVHKDIKNKIIGLFTTNSESEKEIKTKIYNNLIAKLNKEIE